MTATDDGTPWRDAKRALEAAIAACCGVDDLALQHLADRLAAELDDLAFQRGASGA